MKVLESCRSTEVELRHVGVLQDLITFITIKIAREGLCSLIAMMITRLKKLLLAWHNCLGKHSAFTKFELKGCERHAFSALSSTVVTTS